MRVDHVAARGAWGVVRCAGGLLRFLRRHWWLAPILLAALWYRDWYVGEPDQALAAFFTFLQFAINIAFAIVFILVQFVALFWFLGRAQIYWIMPGETGVSFGDYRGNPEVLEQARRIVTLLKGAKKFHRMGGEVSRGMLLVGPPGTGKTWLANVIANEVGIPFGFISGSSIQNMFFGISNLRIMNMYRKARALAREFGAAIIFIDEFDSIGAARTRQGGSGFPLFGGTGLLNEILLQMDPPRTDPRWWARILRKLGIRPRPAPQPLVFTLASTNLPEALDPALLRPGRFDRKIVVEAPDHEGRKDVIHYYIAKVAHDPALAEPAMLDRLSADMTGATPAVIRHVINEAVIKAHFDGRDRITYEDISYALDTHQWGLKRPIRGQSEEARRQVAYHEAGHAVAQLLLLPKQRLYKVTIIRHDQALGLSATRPREEWHVQDEEEIRAQIAVALASQAAEELFLGRRYNGTTSDIQQATWWAKHYVAKWGLGAELVDADQIELSRGQKQEVRDLLRAEKARVKHILARRAALVHALVERLLAKGEVFGDEVAALAEQYPEEVPDDLAHVDGTTSHDRSRSAS